MESILDFEKPIATLEKKLADLKELSKTQGIELSSEIGSLEKKVDSLIDEIFSNLTPWQKVQLSRHPNRPYVLDYVEALFPTFLELHGDRCFSDDRAIVGGIAQWPSDPKASVMIIGHQKGRGTKQRMERNFGMAKPEGYRKSMRLMELAERTRMPVLTFIDTPGAYPGIETEERGQAQIIAENIRLMFELTVPTIAVIVGEGGSGGALALAVGNKVLMQEYSTYSVISPEGCASILWSDSKFSERASEELKMNPKELLKLGVIDRIIKEPKGAAHRNWSEAFRLMRDALEEEVQPYFKGEWRQSKLKKAKNKTAPKKGISKIRLERIKKYRIMGLSTIAQTKETGA